MAPDASGAIRSKVSTIILAKCPNASEAYCHLSVNRPSLATELGTKYFKFNMIRGTTVFYYQLPLPGIISALPLIALTVSILVNALPANALMLL
jgi:hypothetical protein